MCVVYQDIPSWMDLFSNICLSRSERIWEVLFSILASHITHPELVDILGIRVVVCVTSSLGSYATVLHYLTGSILPSKTFIHIFPVSMVF